jgi:hypothetical protein
MRRHRNLSKDGRTDEMMKCKTAHEPLSPRPTIQIRQETVILPVSNMSPRTQRQERIQHRSDAERYLEGTWVIDEVRLAVDKGYKILEILEFYEYEVTCYDPATANGDTS